MHHRNGAMLITRHENRAGLQGRCGAARCGSRWCCLRGGCADRLPHAAGGDRGENSGVIAASTRTRVIRSDSVLLRGPRNLCGLACVQPAMTDCPSSCPTFGLARIQVTPLFTRGIATIASASGTSSGMTTPSGPASDSCTMSLSRHRQQVAPSGRPRLRATPPGGQIQRNPTAPLAHRLPGNSHAGNRAEMPTLCAVTFSPAGPLVAVSADRRYRPGRGGGVRDRRRGVLASGAEPAHDPGDRA